MIPLLLTIIYLVISIYRMGSIPTSISETGYLWKGKINWFSVFCVVLAISMFPSWALLTPELYQFLCFLGCVGLITCGVTPLFKFKFQGTLHCIGCCIAILCWIIWMILLGYWFTLILDIVIFLLLLLIKKKCWILWGELVAIITLSSIMI